jgi:hypothetical protein
MNPDNEHFDKFWSLYPKRPGANKAQARKAWDARIKKGAFPEEILYGAERYRKYCEALKIDPIYIKQAYTFLGPNQHYLLKWEVPKTQRQTWADKLTGKGDEDGFIIDG